MVPATVPAATSINAKWQLWNPASQGWHHFGAEFKLPPGYSLKVVFGQKNPDKSLSDELREPLILQGPFDIRELMNEFKAGHLASVFTVVYMVTHKDITTDMERIVGATQIKNYQLYSSTKSGTDADAETKGDDDSAAVAVPEAWLRGVPATLDAMRADDTFRSLFLTKSGDPSAFTCDGVHTIQGKAELKPVFAGAKLCLELRAGCLRATLHALTDVEKATMAAEAAKLGPARAASSM